MPINTQAYSSIVSELSKNNITLIAVSKKKPVEDLLELYNLGQRDFGENYVQELVEKQAQLPKDIRWHFIGHLQTNKAKLLAPFVQLIHGVDSLRLLQEINKEGRKCSRVIDCLLQLHIAEEETKFGFNERELTEVLEKIKTEPLPNVQIAGLMGMASFSSNVEKVRNEFKKIRSFSKTHPDFIFKIISMGMSGDYKIAVEEGGNMVRIGSLLFGERV